MNKKIKSYPCVSIALSSLFIVLGFFLMPNFVLAVEPDPTIAWNVTTDGFSDGVVVDNFGNVYITGSGTDGVNSGFKTMKYDSNGNELWISVVDNNNGGLSSARGIALDSFGNIYITGGEHVPVSFDSNIRTIKYDNNGNLIWTKIYDSGFWDGASGIVVDTNDNVYVAGYSKNVANDSDFRIIKYDSNGNELWNVIYDGGTNNNEVGVDIALDSASNPIVTGYNYVSDNSFLTIKFDKTNGNVLLNLTYSDPVTIDSAFAITVDSANNIYVAGRRYVSAIFDTDLSIIKYDSFGNEVWNNVYHISDFDDTPYGLAVDSNDNIYAGGYSHNGINTDFRIIKFDGNGNILWNVIYDSGEDDWGNDIAVDDDSNVYITGRYQHTINESRTIKYGQSTDGPILITEAYIPDNGGTYIAYGGVVNLEDIDEASEKITIHSNASAVSGVIQDHKIRYWKNGVIQPVATWFTGGLHSITIDGPLNYGDLIEYQAEATDDAGSQTYDPAGGVTKYSFRVIGSHNVTGFAWSENIGWISFNSNNCDLDGDGLNNDGVIGCLNDGSSNISYGVSLDLNLVSPTFNELSGYAWSENIGWISFEPLDVAGCPSGGNCQPRLVGTEFYGWAKVLSSNGDGWDGWINLNYRNCDTDGGIGNGFVDVVCGGDNIGDSVVDYKVSLTYPDLENWAWGDDVVGWICFNSISPGCDLGAIGPDYRVYILDSNSSPSVDSLDILEADHCKKDLDDIKFSWNFSDLDGHDQNPFTGLPVQTAFEISIDYGAGLCSTGRLEDTRTYASVALINSSGTCSNVIQYGCSGYDWTVTVYDSFDASDSATLNNSLNNMPDHKKPIADFSYDPVDPVLFQDIAFSPLISPDNSICYDDLNSPVDCLTFEWDFDNDGSFDGVTEPSDPMEIYSYSDTGIYIVDLKVTDGAGYSCFASDRGKQKTINIGYGNPSWEEIAPHN
ncbi:MAG: SBBP repeat-containing protein [Candidatus Pacebacteria bacterium]|nr:SBBP repeat-containing protein [Candidatus Paceibacterota bacterium]